MATEKRQRSRTGGVDMQAVICLDMAHQWKLVEMDHHRKGPLSGCAYRQKLCMTCGSLKIETMSWRGEVIARRYISDPDYIRNSRLLADAVNDRRRAYREILLKELSRPRGKICKTCGLPKDLFDHDECK